jgi:hypothetical protein
MAREAEPHAEAAEKFLRLVAGRRVRGRGQRGCGGRRRSRNAGSFRRPDTPEAGDLGEPDFPVAGQDAAAQKKLADIIIQVLPTQLVPDEKEGKILRVRLIQKEGKELFNPAFLFDQGSTISWIPCGRKLTCSFPGIKFYYG